MPGGKRSCQEEEAHGSDPGVVVVPPRMNQGVKPQPVRPKMIGACYRCGKMEHWVASCKARHQQPYPLLKEAEAASKGEHLDGVDKLKGVYVLQSERSDVLTVGIDDTTVSTKKHSLWTITYS